MTAPPAPLSRVVAELDFVEDRGDRVGAGAPSSGCVESTT